jgi:hypothetical protein
MTDTPPPPFKMEVIDDGPSWGCLAGLFFITVIAVAILAVVLMLG